MLGLLPSWANCAEMLSQNHFAEPNQLVFTFLHRILLCMPHSEDGCEMERLKSDDKWIRGHLSFWVVQCLVKREREIYIYIDRERERVCVCIVKDNSIRLHHLQKKIGWIQKLWQTIIQSLKLWSHWIPLHTLISIPVTSLSLCLFITEWQKNSVKQRFYTVEKKCCWKPEETKFNK